jgi:hypothetical protein
MNTRSCRNAATARQLSVLSILIVFSLGNLVAAEPTESRNVKSFGAVCNGTHDDTSQLRAALLATAAKTDASAPIKLVIPNDCVSGPLDLGSNQWIEFEQGAVLHALKGGFPGKGDVFLGIRAKHNVTIKGNHATLVMNRDEYHDGEWRAGVLIYQSKDVQIEDLRIVGAGGDGFTVSGPPTPENISLIDVATENCSRNGISLISGKNVIIRNAILQGTFPNGRGAGTNGPWAGIDVEPNGKAGEALEDISIENVTTEANGGAGLQFTLHELPHVSIHVSNLHSQHDGRHNHGVGLYYGGILFQSGVMPRSPTQGQILIEGTTIDSPEGSGILWRGWSANQAKTILRNTTIRNPGAQTGNINRCGLYFNANDHSFGMKYEPGSHLNVDVDGLVVRDEHKRLVRAVWLEGDPSHPVQARLNNVQEEGNPRARVQLKER